MNAFVLGTGRCGTTTFARACDHIANWTVAHESRRGEWQGRLDYPAGHIEVDHRLAFWLGSLDKAYGDRAVYVHLLRDPEAAAGSWSVRTSDHSLMRCWPRTALYRPEGLDDLAAARLMVRTVTDDIDLFLKDKTSVVRMDIDDPHEGFDRFWALIGAQGDRVAAHATLDRVHNARRP